MASDWLGIGVEIRGRCPSCGAPAMVNAAVLDMLCAACQATISMPRTEWIVALGRIVKEAANGTNCSGIPIPLGQLVEPHFVWEIELPHCGKCSATLEMSDAVERAGSGSTYCVSCGAKTSLRNLHPELTGMQVVAVGEDPNMLPTGLTGTAPPSSARPTRFPCPGCGASLPIDGSARSVSCEYCKTEAFLPDELWRRFHPTTTLRRWHLWADAGPLRAREAWDLEQRRAGKRHH